MRLAQLAPLAQSAAAGAYMLPALSPLGLPGMTIGWAAATLAALVLLTVCRHRDA